MGSPISPIVANLFTQEFEIKAINSVPHPPRLYLRHVDNTFVIQMAGHINSTDQHIQFTQETADPQVSIYFLDTLVSPWPDNTLLIIVYSKPPQHWPVLTLGQPLKFVSYV